MVHGFLGSALNWGPIITRLDASSVGPDLNIFAADLLGHGGRRSSPLGPYTSLDLDLVARDLWLQLKDKTPFVAMGHSFGLRPLLRLYTQHPEAFSGLIVEDSSPVVDPQNYQTLMKILDDTPRPFENRSLAQQYFQAQYPGKMGAFLLSNIRLDSQSNLYDWRFDLTGLRDLLDNTFRESQWKDWAGLQVPVSIIRGERSEFLSHERVQEMQQRLKKPATFMEIENAGHWVHSDNPDKFTDVLISLLKGN